jgi:hypothetical protein
MVDNENGNHAETTPKSSPDSETSDGFGSFIAGFLEHKLKLYFYCAGFLVGVCAIAALFLGLFFPEKMNKGDIHYWYVDTNISTNRISTSAPPGIAVTNFKK